MTLAEQLLNETGSDVVAVSAYYEDDGWVESQHAITPEQLQDFYAQFGSHGTVDYTKDPERYDAITDFYADLPEGTGRTVLKLRNDTFTGELSW